MLSKVVSSSIFKVFGMIRPGIEPRSPGPMSRCNIECTSPAGNRTPVSRVTGGDTYHYTTECEVLHCYYSKVHSEVFLLILSLMKLACIIAKNIRIWVADSNLIISKIFIAITYLNGQRLLTLQQGFWKWFL